MPLPNSNRLRSKQCPVRRPKWRSATTGQQQTAKHRISNVQNENGVLPLLNNKRLRSKKCPMCRPKWRSAPTEQQQTAKRVMSSTQTKMAICHCRVTTVREASNVQCAKQNGDMPPPGNNRPRSE